MIGGDGGLMIRGSGGLELRVLGPGAVCRITGSTPPKRGIGIGGGLLGPGSTCRISGPYDCGPGPSGALP